ncbi:MAG: formyltransferase family protein [Bacteroidota bacterium]
MPEEFKIAIFADNTVGEQAIRFLLEKYKTDVRFIVLADAISHVKEIAIQNGFNPVDIFTNAALASEVVQTQFRSEKISHIILAWWPFIIKEPWLSIPSAGIINFHPSLLPYNRGKNYNFWTLVEDTPFGVSLHFIDESIDGGDIIAQRSISKTWEDSGETLYNRAQSAMVELFIESYPKIRTGDYVRIKQDLSKGSFRYAKDMESAARIDLEKNYKAKDLLNLLRAKTFPPHPAAWFEEDGERFEATIKIIKK